MSLRVLLSLLVLIVSVHVSAVSADEFGRVDRLWFDGSKWRAEERLDNDYVSVTAYGTSKDRCWAARAAGGVDLIYPSGTGWAADTILPEIQFVDIAKKHGGTVEFFGVTDTGQVQRVYHDGQGYHTEQLAMGPYVSVTGCNLAGSYDKCWAARSDGGLEIVDNNVMVNRFFTDTSYTDISSPDSGDGSFYGVTDTGRVDRIYLSGGVWQVEQRIAGDFTSVTAINVPGYYNRCLASLRDGGLVEVIPQNGGYELTRRTMWGRYADMSPVPGEWQPWVVTAMPPNVTPSDIRKQADGSAVSCSGVVTAVFGDCFYISSVDRVSGVKVNLSGHQLTDADVGRLIKVLGYARVRVNEEAAIDAVSVETETERVQLQPLGMGNGTLAAGVHDAVSTRQWQAVELTFTSDVTYPDPYSGVGFSATFTGPGGENYTIPGFWDGGRVWKIRFTPTLPGDWSYTTACGNTGDTGLNGRNGTFSVISPNSNNPLCTHGGFLRVSADRRYLTYSNGRPFFWLGDTWWFCPSDLMPFDYSSSPGIRSCFKTVVDKRREQGYTVAQMAFMTNPGGSGVAERFKRTSEDDVLFWQNMDRYIRYANDSGILPMIGLTFHSGLDGSTLEEWKRAWRYVIARYGAYAVGWLVCGEYNQNNVPDRVTKALALGQFIKDADPYHRAMTIHPWAYMVEQRQAWSQPWYDFVMFQGAHSEPVPPVTLYFQSYWNTPTRPVLEAEVRYEGIAGFTPENVRQVAYRAIQSGSFGYTYGSHGLWYPNQHPGDTTFSDWGTPIPWWEALEREGGEQMRHLRACYEQVEWWKLVPAPNTVSTGINLPEPQRILTKADGDRVFVVYFPSGVDSTLEAVLHGGNPNYTYSARWFDPRMGESTMLPDVSMPGGECVLPVRPGAGDWVLVLEGR